MQHHIANSLHTIGNMLVSCVVIATVGAGNRLWKIAIKKDENCYHSKEARGANAETVYRGCNDIL